MDIASFGRELFFGRLRIDLLDPPSGFPRLDEESEAFLERLRTFCAEKVDSRLIEREARIPDEVINGLKDIGAFCIKIPEEFGGLGLPGVCYHRALMIVGTVHSALSELLAAHQAIGLPQPITLFGTEEQKREFLPRCVREISAFVLTEPDIGNDPFRMHTTAVPVGDGYLLNGVKSWATNGVLADLLVVMAMVPDSPGAGGMTAFVVDARAAGVTVEHRGSFLGLRGLENGVVRLHDVVVPAGNRIGAEGSGLEIALAAQDTGRLSLPAVCAAAAKWSLKIAREWSRVRVQWGRPIGEHEAVAGKIAFIAATAFALEAMVEVSGWRADTGRFDTRTEAELAKLYASEQAWLIADELVQIRGGRGYETAESAAARGERGVPVEQLLRDLRIGRIFDGSSEALRVFIAQDAMAADPVRGSAPEPGYAGFGPLAPHLRFADQASRTLAGQLDRGRSRWPAEIDDRQLFLGRIVDIAAELYAMSASCVYARARSDHHDAATDLADAFCRQARRRVAELFNRLWHNTDEPDTALARAVLADRYTWLEAGILDPSIEGPWIADPTPGPSRRPNLHRTV
ncbi:MAG TPA: acyl-CoA dehydrogenase family protein [Actinophytocola sp.]|uniref:acyl-CoA dehydrogenase family protein n=1 Tax=Actinophytocola sp. TaxID=1872138 RepID=UPI002DDCD39D|nr:acyl-CoA dehydrogenase family protein [Actinophytocola sp.]HEV2780414.1 acyl-CoA dehydrogenase family protein [Actinophytocola sp.]